MVTITVEKAYSADVGHGFVRMSFDVMEKIHLFTDDIVEIHGKQKTVARCKPMCVKDQNKKTIRIDSPTRDNLKVNIGMPVTMRRVVLEPAESVLVTPINKTPPNAEQYVKDCLENHPIMKGNHIVLPYFEEKLVYEILDIKPSQAAIVTRDTNFSIVYSSCISPPR